MTGVQTCALPIYETEEAMSSAAGMMDHFKLSILLSEKRIPRILEY